MQYDFQIRVTGILIEDGKILLVQQRLSENRAWSLPGGRLEQGETLEQGVVREFKEETGLDVAVDRLLYVCDIKHSGYTAIHVTFFWIAKAACSRCRTTQRMKTRFMMCSLCRSGN